MTTRAAGRCYGNTAWRAGRTTASLATVRTGSAHAHTALPARDVTARAGELVARHSALVVAFREADFERLVAGRAGSAARGPAWVAAGAVSRAWVGAFHFLAGGFVGAGYQCLMATGKNFAYSFLCAHRFFSFRASFFDPMSTIFLYRYDMVTRRAFFAA